MLEHINIPNTLFICIRLSHLWKRK